MKKYSRQEQKLLAIWTADCAERVLPFFEKAYPKDDRPVKSIKKCREWARTGIFRMADIRKASLDSHAAARKAKRITLLVLQQGQQGRQLQQRMFPGTHSELLIMRLRRFLQPTL